MTEDRRQPLTVVLTGASPGRRLNRLGPKPLWRVADGGTVFECQLRVLNREATERPVVVGGFEFERLRDGAGWGAEVVRNREWDRLGCGCSAQVGLYHAREGRVLLAHGDVVYTRFDLPPSGSWVVTTGSPPPDCGEVGVTDDAGWVAHMEYGVERRWAQAVVLDRAERAIFEALPLRKETLYEAVNRCVEGGGRFGVHAPTGLLIVDVDRPADFALARKICPR